MEMNSFILKRKTFTKYDETDAIKRMKDSDILAQEKRKPSSYKSVLRDIALGSAGGAAIGGAIGGLGKKGTLKGGATKGAILGALILGSAGLRKKYKDDEDIDFYNRRLEYAQRRAKRRERIDWIHNNNDREGYSF